MRATTDGNQVQFLLDGGEYFAALHQLLDDLEHAAHPAQSYVKLAFWKANPRLVVGRARIRLVEKLHNVAATGAQVRMILWQPDSVVGRAWPEHVATNRTFRAEVG